MYRLVFANPEYGSYDYLQDEEDLYAAIKEECVQSVEDKGSDGYDPSYYIRTAEDELGLKYDPDVDDEDHWAVWQRAADIAIETSAALWAVSIFDDLWRGAPDENGLTWSRLPFDGPTIYLDAQENYDPSPTYFG